jgi:hypothetical protein
MSVVASVDRFCTRYKAAIRAQPLEEPTTGKYSEMGLLGRTVITVILALASPLSLLSGPQKTRYMRLHVSFPVRLSALSIHHRSLLPWALPSKSPSLSSLAVFSSLPLTTACALHLSFVASLYLVSRRFRVMSLFSREYVIFFRLLSVQFWCSDGFICTLLLSVSPSNPLIFTVRLAAISASLSPLISSLALLRHLSPSHFMLLAHSEHCYSR